MSLPPLDVPGLLRTKGIHPNKSLGQNFLLDDSALKQIIAAAEISPDDVVLEIGPGVGSLTRLLASVAQKVIAVELDPRLILVLKQVVGQFANVDVIEGDILALDINKVTAGRKFIVVANIPYYITSALIRHLLESARQPQRIILTIQEEVAERICASPGKMSLLALSVQVYGQPVITECIPASAFYPSPQVDSSIIRIDIFTNPKIPAGQLETFFILIKAGFSQKRKTLRNALSAGLHKSSGEIEQLLENCQIDSMRRAETLSLAEWQCLTAACINSLIF